LTPDIADSVTHSVTPVEAVALVDCTASADSTIHTDDDVGDDTVPLEPEAVVVGGAGRV